MQFLVHNEHGLKYEYVNGKSLILPRQDYSGKIRQNQGLIVERALHRKCVKDKKEVMSFIGTTNLNVCLGEVEVIGLRDFDCIQDRN